MTKHTHSKNGQPGTEANGRRMRIIWTRRIRAPKGTKERWKAAATDRGKSLNQFIVGAVEAEIQAEKQPGE